MPEVWPRTILRCPDCEGHVFVKIIGLERGATTGMIETIEGYLCQSCQKRVNVSAMHANADLQRLKDELDEKQRAYDALQPKKSAPGLTRS